MATSIANLAVLLTAKTDAFGKGMRKAQIDLGAFATGIVSATANVAKYAAGLTAVAAAATAVFVKRSMDAIDSTAKLSDRLGIATEDLLGLRYAADIAGGGADALDDALAKFAKGLGDPSTEFVESLDKLGLSTARLLGQDPAANFKLIADRINDLATQEEKAAVMADLYGKSSGELLTMVKLGSQGLTEMGQELQKLGGMYSRDGAMKVEEFNDSLTRLGVIFGGIINQITIELSPMMTLLIEKFTNASKESGSMGSVVSQAMQSVVNGIDSAIDSIKGFGIELKRVGSIALRTINDIMTIGHLTDKIFGKSWAEEMADSIDRNVGKERVKNQMRPPSTAITDAYNQLQQQASNQARITGILNLLEKQFSQIQARDKARESVKTMLRNGLNNTVAFVQDLSKRAAGMRAISGYGAMAKDWWQGQVKRAQNFMMRGPASEVTGARGTFSGETAGRMQGTYSISLQQLQEAKRQSTLLERIIEGVNGGAVVG